MIPNFVKIKKGYEELKNRINIQQENDFIIAKSGYEILYPNICRQGNHYFGSLIIHKIDGYFNNLGNETVASFSKDTIGINNTACFLSNTLWDSNILGYCWMSDNSIIISDKTNSNKYNYAKINVNLVTNE